VFDRFTITIIRRLLAIFNGFWVLLWLAFFYGLFTGKDLGSFFSDWEFLVIINCVGVLGVAIWCAFDTQDHRVLKVASISHILLVAFYIGVIVNNIEAIFLLAPLSLLHINAIKLLYKRIQSLSKINKKAAV